MEIAQKQKKPLETCSQLQNRIMLFQTKVQYYEFKGLREILLTWDLKIKRKS